MTAPKIIWYYRIVNWEIVKTQIRTEDSYVLLIDAKSALAERLAKNIRELNERRFKVWKLTRQQIKEI